MIPASHGLSQTICHCWFLSKLFDFSWFWPIAQDLTSMTLESFKTLPLTDLFVGVHPHSSGQCLYFHSRQIALNNYIRLREVSLMLMAIFRLQPLLLLQHSSQSSSPSRRLIHLCQRSRWLPEFTEDFTFYHEYDSYNNQTSTSKTIAFHRLFTLYCQFPSSLRDRITWLSTLLLIMPASCLSLNLNH